MPRGSVEKAIRVKESTVATVPSAVNPACGYRFHPRCFARVSEICERESPPFFQIGKQRVACWRYQ
jgi:ABC-type dipeptide/oligopeptide/nickel transport system ATPase component